MKNQADALNQVRALRAGYQVVIDELRAMGMSEQFIANFIDSGDADAIADKASKKTK